MIVITRNRQEYSDTIRLDNEDGTLFAELRFTVNPEKMIKDYIRISEHWNKLRQAEKPDMEALGEGYFDIVALFFGKDGAEQIFEFFEGRYIDMVQALQPVFEKEITPRLEAYAKKLATFTKKRAFRK